MIGEIHSSEENIKDAKSFLEFHYPEVKDFSKQFLTVVAAVLAVTVTFSEKIVNFTTAPTLPRVLMMLVWCGGIVAFMFGGAAILFIYDAGALAKATEKDGKMFGYYTLLRRSYNCLLIGGGVFVVSLILLVVTGLLKAF
ncbi:MAG TPA: hypothetical protein PKY59_20480 [Pyrinomonadaceae bacterium]|nr:hypothetical protein [Pyrinomonadaceae bacterium]